MTLDARSLTGGNLSQVLLSQMVPESKRDQFNKAARPPPPSLLPTWMQSFGWTPPKELAEWAGLRTAYRRLRDSISEAWVLDGELSRAEKLARRAASKASFDDEALLVTAFTGLEPFGTGPSGDAVFVSTLPDASGTAAMHVFNHEIAEFDGPDYGSLAAFLAAHFHLDPKTAPAIRKLVNAHLRELKQRWKARPVHQDGVALFRRTRWLAESIGGKLPYRFAEKLAHAPTYATWEKEKALLPRTPVLANYWMLAHHLLGNAEALDEALALGGKAPGLATAAIVQTIRTAREGKPFGGVPADQVARLRAAIVKNAPPALLAPAAQSAKTAARSAGVSRLSAAEEKKRLAAGESGWELIRAFPADLAAHQRLLKAMGAKDKQLAKVLSQFAKQGNAELYDQWPGMWSKEVPPKELSCAVAAAFRAGLNLDADNPRSNRGYTQTLRYFDDDFSAEAWAEAIEKLAGEDDRLEYVLEDLETSTHPRAPALLYRAAERFFELRSEAVRRKQELAEQGGSLDALVSVNSHLLAAVLHVLRGGGPQAAAIAAKALAHGDEVDLLGTALGLAFRVAGEQGLKEHLGFVTRYLEMMHEWVASADEAPGAPNDPDHAEENEGAERIGDADLVNLTEGAVALASLAPPDEAQRLLRKLHDRERKNPLTTLDVRAAMLAGLLPLAQGDRALLATTERVLGNRTGAMRVYGALRAVERSGSGEAAWVRPHLYTELSLSRLNREGPLALRAAARKAMEALGETAPEWEEGDEYAGAVATEELPQALLAPHKHRPASVFEKIRKANLQHPNVVRYGGPVLEDRLRYEGDDPQPDSDLMPAFQALTFQGAASVPVFMRLLSLPHVTPGTRTTLLLCLRAVSSEVEVRAWLRSAGRKEVLAQLASPEPRFLPWLDLVAATAAVRWGADARGAVLGALERRIERAQGPGYGGFSDQETTLHCLPRVLAGLGPEGLAEVDRLRAIAAKGHAYDMTSALAAAAQFAKVPDSRHGWKGPLSLSTGLQEGHAPKLSFTVTLQGTEVSWASRFEGLVFYFIIPGATQEAAETVTFDTADRARAYARELEETALRLGFRAPKEQKKKR